MGYADREPEPQDQKFEVTERELKEIQHALFYQTLNHGTIGHNVLILLAKFAEDMGFYLDRHGELEHPSDRRIVIVPEKRG
jgi:hypothetical protein